jgi:hypothetical protein
MPAAPAAVKAIDIARLVAMTLTHSKCDNASSSRPHCRAAQSRNPEMIARG